MGPYELPQEEGTTGIAQAITTPPVGRRPYPFTRYGYKASVCQPNIVGSLCVRTSVCAIVLPHERGLVFWRTDSAGAKQFLRLDTTHPICCYYGCARTDSQHTAGI